MRKDLVTSQESDMQNTVAQPSESVKPELPVAVNIPPVSIQAPPPPTPVTTVQQQPAFMSGNLQAMPQDSARPSTVQNPVTGKVQMDVTDFTSLMGFVR